MITEWDVREEFREDHDPFNPERVQEEFLKRTPREVKDLKETLLRAVKDTVK
jgi:hypothetical protein